MMYLSQLMINLGDNPDRPRPGKMWLRNIYHVHQRLSMAFPSPEQRRDDPFFLSPYQPARFEMPRFLFRIDHSLKDDSSRAVILVQSPIEPAWEYAFQNAPMLLAAPPQVLPWQDPNFKEGAQYHFRIQVNLSKKGRTSKEGASLRQPRRGADRKGRPKDQGKRIAVTWNEDEDPEDVLREWFTVKASRCGFEINEFFLRQLGWVQGRKPTRNGKEKEWRRLRFRSALLEGGLTVTNTTLFRESWASGIGSAKAFGLGLLSVSAETKE